ncbi:hypothetical protein HHL17_01405 [Chitinophaga sp. G-6-1-13]|uniref:Acetyltransferase n=1 Tax=Chitinophaga fulva TaxID=2728842 RepID=A0A848GGI1_9BACT|nr:DapH/DapD/GlmU-related protein [Chitinophaga fulva]NML35840.1 hypothetical protein [Chitinophaga fulva]
MDIILVGAFSEMIELADLCGSDITGIIDVREAPGYPLTYLGKDDDARAIFGEYGDKADIILSPDIPIVREKLFAFYKNIGFRIGSLLSPHARISKSANLDVEGLMVQSGVNLSANTVIGRGVRLNVNANVMHDCVVGAFTTIAPNAVLLGKVTLGSRVYVGANTTILPGITVGDDVIIGAGAVVTKNIEKGDVVAGVPARVIRKQ